MKHIESNLKEDSIIYQPFNKDAARAFDETQRNLNNVNYQRKDLEGAYRLLGIP